MDNALTPRRDGAVDLAKALAICAVVLIHCSANHFAHHPAGSFQWLAACFWGSVSRWAVPVFLLCSGALMNAPGRDLPLKKLFSRYLLRLALALAVWAGLYELLRIYTGQGSAPLSQLAVQSAKNWLTGTTYYHLYYFYFAIALYLALPLTRLIARHASRAELRYLLALWFLTGSVIPFCRYFPPFDQLGASLLRYSLPAIFLSPGLGLLGWYLGQHPPKSCREGLVLFLAGFGVTFLGTWRRSAAA
ncbi:MAG: acyltransferase family protein, partial [Oscillospiraceae bacterium]|nr:acyltransferase family protein [Oscillospiraceae bacterium]